MLKALELVGFKSFADRTRFEFPRGVTVIVGPNGSGKSNIVDSIKWVLGEQSVKSLRGHEMTDVIFNGSGTRRAMNSAEITLTFDNANQIFPLNTPEVSVTRRVYRGGEGEYLINRAPARLRDIRDLLSGTGLGTQAYSVIEQGKVDALLQSSAKDRRMIFEEAAGISRFKAKKIEAVRRLERVEQNLLRLRDIVDEVENRLRNIRAQAGKARRYKEYSDRLQELRTQAAMGDFRVLQEKLDECETRLVALGQQREALTAANDAVDARLADTDGAMAALDAATRETEGLAAANRERIAANESAVEHERARLAELEQEIARCGRQLVAMTVRAGDLRQQLEETVAAVQTAETEHQQITLRLVESERRLTDAMGQLDRLQDDSRQRRSAHLAEMRTVGVLGSEQGALESRLKSAVAARERGALRIAETRGQLDAAAAHLEESRRLRDQHAAEVEQRQQRLLDARGEVGRLDTELTRRQEEVAELRHQLTATIERAKVLAELERRQEGLTAGVKEVLDRSRATDAGPFREVCGLVADLLNVSLEAAPLVETALGAAAQHVVVDGEALREQLSATRSNFAGRVGFLWLENKRALPDAGIDFDRHPGVVGRASNYVETPPRYATLVRRLLGRTWIVETLAHAFQFARMADGTARFVTLAGELLESDGILSVGPAAGAIGLISRRSQLRALDAQREQQEAMIAAASQTVEELQHLLAEAKRTAETRTAEHRRASDSFAEQRSALGAAETRYAQIERQHAALEEEVQAAAAEHDEAQSRLAETTAKKEAAEVRLAEMESALSETHARLERIEAERQGFGREATQTKVELAKSEERLRNLNARLAQFEENRQERRRAVGDCRDQLGQFARRAEGSRWNILRAESEIAELYLRKEKLAAETAASLARSEEIRRERIALASEAQKGRNRLRKMEEKIHEEELAAGAVRSQQNALVDRLREDYGIELSSANANAPSEEELRRSEVQAEIDDLRGKLNQLGNVNLEALDELDDLESRFKTLSDQYNDLTSAKDSLEKIIQKINGDSRRLFEETLATVRGHFQQLFRDLFGGGSADIIIEDGADMLEGGLEITARPPGKEPRSISLLSGGEKTMTCVALLLALFRSRPSPFCVLDEVDAALDEANIDRFTKVLKDFLAWTQFIIVTHSKKTMTAAQTLYGVTMQESGVSKQVSVRFEDVSDDGHILPERLAREQGHSRAA